jgi:hypothetical protein
LLPLDKGLQVLPLRIGEISHALCLHHLHFESDCLFTSDVGEIGSTAAIMAFESISLRHAGQVIVGLPKAMYCAAAPLLRLLRQWGQ